MGLDTPPSLIPLDPTLFTRNLTQTCTQTTGQPTPGASCFAVPPEKLVEIRVKMVVEQITNEVNRRMRCLKQQYDETVTQLEANLLECKEELAHRFTEYKRAHPPWVAVAQREGSKAQYTNTKSVKCSNKKVGTKKAGVERRSGSFVGGKDEEESFSLSEVLQMVRDTKENTEAKKNERVEKGVEKEITLNQKDVDKVDIVLEKETQDVSTSMSSFIRPVSSVGTLTNTIETKNAKSQTEKEKEKILKNVETETETETETNIKVNSIGDNNNYYEQLKLMYNLYERELMRTEDIRIKPDINMKSDKETSITEECSINHDSSFDRLRARERYSKLKSRYVELSTKTKQLISAYRNMQEEILQCSNELGIDNSISDNMFEHIHEYCLKTYNSNDINTKHSKDVQCCIDTFEKEIPTLKTDKGIQYNYIDASNIPNTMETPRYTFINTSEDKDEREALEILYTNDQTNVLSYSNTEELDNLRNENMQLRAELDERAKLLSESLNSYQASVQEQESNQASQIREYKERIKRSLADYKRIKLTGGLDEMRMVVGNLERAWDKSNTEITHRYYTLVGALSDAQSMESCLEALNREARRAEEEARVKEEKEKEKEKKKKEKNFAEQSYHLIPTETLQPPCSVGSRSAHSAHGLLPTAAPVVPSSCAETMLPLPDTARPAPTPSLRWPSGTMG